MYPVGFMAQDLTWKTWRQDDMILLTTNTPPASTPISAEMDFCRSPDDETFTRPSMTCS